MRSCSVRPCSAFLFIFCNFSGNHNTIFLIRVCLIIITRLADFQISHPYRDECYIRVGLGDPADPHMVKDMQAYFFNGSTYTLYSGHVPFPGNALALDVSEFAAFINDYDLFLEIVNFGSTAGSVTGFSVEFYSDYDGAPFRIISGTTGTVSGGSTVFAAGTEGALTAGELAAIQPPLRTAALQPAFSQRTPTAVELAQAKARIGVYRPGADYNPLIMGYGTGLVPPTESEWESMVRLESVDGAPDRGSLPDQIDNSATQYFPPIGNQANEGSCVAFSVGYYIHTYQEAREHGWDLSSTSWTGGYYGQPDSNRDRIMSPDFVYHQINGGVDGGARYYNAVGLVTVVGGASWEQMPYDTSDHATWPSEAAFREAARYRGAAVGASYWLGNHHGYFIIQDDSDIDLLKQLLAEGYCVSTAVDAYEMYDYMDTYDVVSGTTIPVTGTNHANTIVGYKEGSAWDPADPEN